MRKRMRKGGQDEEYAEQGGLFPLTSCELQGNGLEFPVRYTGLLS